MDSNKELNEYLDKNGGTIIFIIVIISLIWGYKLAGVISPDEIPYLPNKHYCLSFFMKFLNTISMSSFCFVVITATAFYAMECLLKFKNKHARPDIKQTRKDLINELHKVLKNKTDSRQI